MRHCLTLALLLLGCTGSIRAQGLMIPDDREFPRLAMVSHRVNITLEDQVGVTRVEQTFHNHTSRQIEATYVFPVPKGASVNQFTMWVNGREVKGEMVEAGRARQIYTDIVRRTCDPGLLEYMGNNLFRLRVFPILPGSDQKVSLSYTSMAQRDGGIVEYVYPLKTDGRSTGNLQDFSVEARIRSQNPIQNIYSPTHAITVTRQSDREATVRFDRYQCVSDKDFLLFYAVSDKDIGFTMLPHRPMSGEKGYFLFLLTPRVEVGQRDFIPRDMILVLDTSGSMRGPKMDQARRALKYCLDNLDERDRFAVIHFATSVHKFRDYVVESKRDNIDEAKRWVDGMEANGGTAIDDALSAALDMRASETGRTATIVFFTDGEPTVGVTNVEQILRNVSARNSASTRIFTFGVGDDVNATFLDRLADQTRAVSTYVRPAEDIEAKVSGLYSKISHPVLANLKLSTSENVRLDDIYPPQLPDLYHGGQLTVLGRYSGQGHAAITLSGTVGQDRRTFVYEVPFPERTDSERNFVEQLWARRKVGYLLDQIRANGEKRELVDETIALAKRYGIATPYTSYLVVPDGPVPVVHPWHRRGHGGPTPLGAGGMPGMQGPGLGLSQGQGFGGGIGGFGGSGGLGGSLRGPVPSDRPAPKVIDFAQQVQTKPGDLALNRDRITDGQLGELEKQGMAGLPGGQVPAFQQAAEQKFAYDQARKALAGRRQSEVQAGKLGVDLSVNANALRNQTQLAQTAVRQVAGRNCMEVGGVWIDDGFDPKLPKLVVKAQSAAYFRILERQPQVRDVFKLGNFLVWITPNGTALVIDSNDGKETLSDAEIDALFVRKG
jgi:Ca-activated chloride channel family protein